MWNNSVCLRITTKYRQSLRDVHTGTENFSRDALFRGRTLDYDTMPEKYIELTVTATDGGGLSGTATVTVWVEDVNDLPPEVPSEQLV